MDFCLERFDFYSDVVFVCIAYSCHWEWANASAVVLVIATLGQAVGAAVAYSSDAHSGQIAATLLGFVPHPAAGMAPPRGDSPPAEVAGHALARVVLEDLPQARGDYIRLYIMC